jgi:hypothetical protein
MLRSHLSRSRSARCKSKPCQAKPSPGDGGGMLCTCHEGARHTHRITAARRAHYRACSCGGKALHRHGQGGTLPHCHRHLDPVSARDQVNVLSQTRCCLSLFRRLLNSQAFRMKACSPIACGEVGYSVGFILKNAVTGVSGHV